MIERFTFADSVTGLDHAWTVTLSLRARGFKTHLETYEFKGFTLHTVVATPSRRPSRKERGCNV